MFRHSSPNFEKTLSTNSLPMDFTVLNIKPSPVDELAALGRPGGLKPQINTLIKSIDDHHEAEKEKEKKKVEGEKNKNRIGADSSMLYVYLNNARH